MRYITVLIAGFLSLAATTAHRDYKVGSLIISDPWAPATPKGVAVGAGYMKISNKARHPTG